MPDSPEKLDLASLDVAADKRRLLQKSSYFPNNFAPSRETTAPIPNFPMIIEEIRIQNFKALKEDFNKPDEELDREDKTLNSPDILAIIIS